MPDLPPALRFTAQDQHAAWEAWGCNCGPGALAAVVGMTLDELRPHLGDFEEKRYTDVVMMLGILDSIRVEHHAISPVMMPRYGLARIQWEGPWTEPDQPAEARLRHSHWVGVQSTLEHKGLPSGFRIFDINAMQVGGWLHYTMWSKRLVPWILEECEPEANGRWHITNAFDIVPKVLTTP